MSWVLNLAAYLAVLLAAYIGECVLWPYARCRWCAGSGRRTRDDRVVWGDCRHCGGSGRRIRLGRWLWDRTRRRGRS